MHLYITASSKGIFWLNSYVFIDSIEFVDGQEREEAFALLTALKSSARFLRVTRVTVLLEFDVLDALFAVGFFLLCGSAAGGTCSFCFFPILSKPSYTVSDILIGTGRKARLELLFYTSSVLYSSS